MGFSKIRTTVKSARTRQKRGQAIWPGTNRRPQKRSYLQGDLPAALVVKVGGISATAQYAGVVSPGLYQFNIVVPPKAPDGDNTLTAAYNGLDTQPGVLLAVGR
jgi:uncharacterized protein (TIGR03437 family)